MKKITKKTDRTDRTQSRTKFRSKFSRKAWEANFLMMEAEELFLDDPTTRQGSKPRAR